MSRCDEGSELPPLTPRRPPFAPVCGEVVGRAWGEIDLGRGRSHQRQAVLRVATRCLATAIEEPRQAHSTTEAVSGNAKGGAAHVIRLQIREELLDGSALSVAV